MPNRLIAIGDIHGYSAALAALLGAIDPRSDDVLVTLGDYCDRGPDTADLGLERGRPRDRRPHHRPGGTSGGQRLAPQR